MASFSERQGYRPIRAVIQKDEIDDALRTGLWNVLDICIFEATSRYVVNDSYVYIPDFHNFLRRMWVMHFKLAVDSLPTRWTHIRQHFRHHFFTSPWYDLYDFIEYVSQNYPDQETAKTFAAACNIALERELSGYETRCNAGHSP
jgi:hypothetical protein